LAAAGSAQAQADLFSRDTVSGLVDLRLVAADGETSWIDGAVGKARFGNGHQGLRLGEAALVWNPRFSDTLSAVVVARARTVSGIVVDLGEGYLAYRSRPGGPCGCRPARASSIRRSRWSTTASTGPCPTPSPRRRSTPGWPRRPRSPGSRPRSAHDSRPDVQRHGGGFTHGDTSGTELTFRGWALHDLKSPVFGRFPLPPLSRAWRARQAPSTTPLAEIDGACRLLRADRVATVVKLAFDLFRYDNEGDRISVNADREWSWETRFWNLGMRLDLGAVAVKAQAMTGETLMGYSNANGVWADAGFEAAYVSATKALGPGLGDRDATTISRRDRTNKGTDNNAEHGWSALAAYRWDVKPNAQIVFEALHIDSFRPDRARLGLSPAQDQTVLQTAFRQQF
jgi:hypothetical protein